MRFKCAILLTVAVLIAGCGAGVDDTVLPGPREDAIPGQAVFPAPGEDKLQTALPGDGAPEDIAVAPVCPDPGDKSDPNCVSDDSSSGGTFSDGQ